MSSTTKKHRDFVNEPMGSKGVIVIPGIGDKFAAQLQNQGYNQAFQVYGQYLVMGRNEERFYGWLTDSFRFMNVKHQRAIFQGLDEYCNCYLN